MPGTTQKNDKLPAIIDHYSDQEITRRIQLNRRAKFGLENASPDQLNVIFVLARRWQLDPVTDITLFHGTPWITIEGHLRLLRRHPEYRGFSQRPLEEEEKGRWGYEADDIVVETTIRTEKWGEIVQRGRVARWEVMEALAAAEKSGRRAAPAGTHPVELAEKRSLARAHRAAFGQDAPDEETIEQEIRTEVRERMAPERVRELAAEYDRIWGDQPVVEAAPPAADASVEEGSGADQPVGPEPVS